MSKEGWKLPKSYCGYNIFECEHYLDTCATNVLCQRCQVIVNECKSITEKYKRGLCQSCLNIVCSDSNRRLATEELVSDFIEMILFGPTENNSVTSRRSIVDMDDFYKILRACGFRNHNGDTVVDNNGRIYSHPRITMRYP